MDWLRDNWDNLLAAWGGLTALCSAIVAMTPSTKDNKILEYIVKIVDLFSVVYPKDKRK